MFLSADERTLSRQCTKTEETLEAKEIKHMYRGTSEAHEPASIRSCCVVMCKFGSRGACLSQQASQTLWTGGMQNTHIFPTHTTNNKQQPTTNNIPLSHSSSSFSLEQFHVVLDSHFFPEVLEFFDSSLASSTQTLIHRRFSAKSHRVAALPSRRKRLQAEFVN